MILVHVEKYGRALVSTYKLWKDRNLLKYFWKTKWNKVLFGNFLTRPTITLRLFSFGVITENKILKRVQVEEAAWSSLSVSKQKKLVVQTWNGDMQQIMLNLCQENPEVKKIPYRGHIIDYLVMRYQVLASACILSRWDHIATDRRCCYFFEWNKTRVLF